MSKNFHKEQIKRFLLEKKKIALKEEINSRDLAFINRWSDFWDKNSPEEQVREAGKTRMG